ncbi:GDSL-type esterase/lipase family protein [Ensifer adhaerens]|uniref:GDSL-type esterase/lipase family protein n=1 Tax=Ensifer adhaerens TaxID=106592 RepID=UPI0015C34CFA|nr:GDSL-type esterase/lipase family protein [Ensifer adhaerens]
MLKFLRDTVVIVAITGVIFAGIEFGLRAFAPQRLDTTLIGGEPLGLRDPVLGHVNRPNAHIKVTGPEYTSDYQVNSQGFRDLTVYPPSPTPGVTRILLVGDSFAFGVGNAYDEAWAVILEKSLRDAGRKVEIIKAGVPAYDTRTETLYIERLVDQLHPDAVVMTFLTNDLFTNMPLATDGAATQAGAEQTEFNDPAVRASSDKKSSLHSVVLATRLMMMNDAIYMRLYQVTPRADYFRAHPTDVMNRQMATTRALLTRAREFCRTKDIEFAVVSIPQLFQVIARAKGEESELIDAGYVDREFTAFAAEQGMGWFPMLAPLADAYAATGEELYYRFDGHLTPAGNRVVATSLTPAFNKWLGEIAGLPVAAKSVPAN